MNKALTYISDDEKSQNTVKYKTKTLNHILSIQQNQNSVDSHIEVQNLYNSIKFSHLDYYLKTPTISFQTILSKIKPTMHKSKKKS